jgi:hypothetical protein
LTRYQEVVYVEEWLMKGDFSPFKIPKRSD